MVNSSSALRVTMEVAPSNPMAAGGATKPISLALQGGGAHGALSWGVMDRLLEDERIEIGAVSATSIGALNAVVMVYGHTLGGRDGARQALAGFWRRIAHIAAASPFQSTWWDRLMGDGSLDASPAYLWADLMSRVWSPYQTNPLDFNPLRDALLQSVDFEVLKRLPRRIRLCVNATDVKTGASRIFRDPEISLSAIMAASCAPLLFQAVEIEGEHYWDGAYSANPALSCLRDANDAPDILVVRVDSLGREQLPMTASEIMSRMNEMSFSANLDRELRLVESSASLGSSVQSFAKAAPRLHIMSPGKALNDHRPSSRLNADWDYLQDLRAQGRHTADQWLNDHFDELERDFKTSARATYS